jgi:hypothetical protein
LNSSTWSYPVALELVLHSAIVTDFAMERLPDPFSCPLLPFMQPKLLQTVASVLRRSSHTDGACFPGKEQEFLTYRPHQRSGGSHRREEHSLALPPEGPDSVRVTFSRRSPQCRPFRPFEIRCNRERNGPGTLPAGHLRRGKRSHT